MGYRAPAWQMTATTFALLGERGFVYDSSMMGDDRPYREHVGDTTLVEIPVHWGLDDYPHFGSVEDDLGPMRDPREVFEIWWIEVESAIAERRTTSFCFHPEVIGRAWTFAPFEQFVRRLHDDPRVRLARCVDVASAFPADGLERDGWSQGDRQRLQLPRQHAALVWQEHGREPLQPLDRGRRDGPELERRGR